MLILLRLTLVIVAVALGFVVYAAEQPLALIIGQTYRGVIIPAELAPESLGHLYDGFWLPSTNDIAGAEAAIATYLATAESDQSLDLYTRTHVTMIFAKLSQYRRQYVGVLLGGQKRIYCNALTPDEKRYKSWRTRYVLLPEGDSDCWRMEINLSSKDCRRFTAAFGY